MPRVSGYVPSDQDTRRYVRQRADLLIEACLAPIQVHPASTVAAAPCDASVGVASRRTRSSLRRAMNPTTEWRAHTEDRRGFRYPARLVPPHTHVGGRSR